MPEMHSGDRIDRVSVLVARGTEDGAMSGSDKGAEQSMDEILASIKRIISDDPARSSADVKPAEAFGAKDIDASLDSLLKSMQGQVLPAPAAGSVGVPDADASSEKLFPSLSFSSPAEPAEKEPPQPSLALPSAPPAAVNGSAPPTASRPVADPPSPTSTLEAIRQRARRAAGLAPRTEPTLNGSHSHQDTVSEAQPVVSPAQSTGTGGEPKAGAGPTVSKPLDAGPKQPDVQVSAAAAVPKSPGVSADAALSASAAAMSALAGGGAMTATGRSLEDAVKELLRPMLKQWLDDNLKGIVEQVLREELVRRQIKQ